MNDLEKLRILSIFHFVVGALSFLLALFPSIHLTLFEPAAPGVSRP